LRRRRVAVVRQDAERQVPDRSYSAICLVGGNEAVDVLT
jgi:hypothetical protein